MIIFFVHYLNLLLLKIVNASIYFWEYLPICIYEFSPVQLWLYV